ncbi:hypothetical protein HK097_006652, partial [Rhizophlyctis rosea]
MEREWDSVGNVERVEGECVEWVARRVDEEGGAERSGEGARFLIRALGERFARGSGEGSEFETKGAAFVRRLEEFLEGAVRVRVGSGVESRERGDEDDDERVDAIVGMMRVLKRMGRWGIYAKLAREVVEGWVGRGMWVEAGLAVRMAGEGNGREREGDEEAWMWKETWVEKCVDMFDRGGAWERAVEMCAVLKEGYMRRGEVGELARVLRREAEMWEKVGGVERYPVAYYRVGFLG